MCTWFLRKECRDAEVVVWVLLGIVLGREEESRCTGEQIRSNLASRPRVTRPDVVKHHHVVTGPLNSRFRFRVPPFANPGNVADFKRHVQA